METTNKQDVNKIDLFTFLDTYNLTRAERSYYEKHYSTFKGQERKVKEWENIVKFIHS